jgi:polyphosphate kinase
MPNERNGAREITDVFCSATSRICPPAGEIVIFDRSWYDRAGVAHVIGFCTEERPLR